MVMAIDIPTVIFRFTLTYLFALIFGIERHKAHKPISFGAFVFVAIGSCALAITAVRFGGGNPLPLLGAIVTGIGFLGAGALIRTSDKIFGFTTAASIWVFAIIGLVIGLGEYLIGFIIYALIWMVIAYDKFLERKGIGYYQRKIIINTNKIINDKEIKAQLLFITKKFKLISLDVDKKNDKLSMIYLIEGSKEEINKIPKKLFEKDWLESCKVE